MVKTQDVRLKTSQIQKWKSIFAIYMMDGLAYRASAVIWILTDLVTALTMPFVWASASAASSGTIQGYRTGDIVVYYLALILIQNFVTSHLMWDLAVEIREGNFTVSLVRPISYFQVCFFRNLSWRILRIALFTPMLLGLIFLYHRFLVGESIHISWLFIVAVIGGHLVSFFFAMMMSMIALFTTEVFSIFELYYVPLLFLSGQLFPVGFMPGWAQVIAKALPFYYTTGAPTEILIGRLQGAPVYEALCMQLFWIVAAYVLARLLWAKGLKQYTAVGM